MRKKIFITTQYMELGGVERSLIGLLDAIDYSQYDVDVFIQHHSGELMSHINSKANLLPELPMYASMTKSIVYAFKKGYFQLVLGRLKAKFLSKKYDFTRKNNASIFQYIADYTTKYLPKITDESYDLAISFHHPHDIVLDKISASKKIAWIHTDYSMIFVDVNRELPKWNQFDHIIAISELSKKSFIYVFPSLSDKIVVAENILSPYFIREQSKESIHISFKHVSILTVGRFCYPKAFDRAVRLCAGLVKRGLNIRWYAIGYGDDSDIKREIERLKMHEHFIILGKHANPYPYMNACTAYVQPSRYEGKSVAVREAQILGKPVIVTNYPSATDQIRNGIDGIIVSSDEKEAVEQLFEILNNQKLLDTLSMNCLNEDFGNLKEINKIYQLI